jgi:predicted permease
MSDVLAITGPIYLLIALGWVSVRRGWFSRDDLRIFGRFMMTLCLPALVFDAVSRRSPAEVLHLPFLAAYAAGSVLVLLGGFVWARWRRGAPAALAALQGMGMACPNSGYVGFPILMQLIGPAAGVALALAMVVENLLLIPLGLALADAGGQASRRAALKQALASLARNPLVLSIAAGFMFALLGWRLPQPLERTVSLLAMASSPIALFVIGGTLVGLKLEGVRVDLLRVALGKLLLHPLAVGAALALLPPFDPVLRTAAVVLAAMPMMGIYPVLAQKYGHDGFCAATLLATTVLSFFTISTGLWWLRQQPAWLPG